MIVNSGDEWFLPASDKTRYVPHGVHTSAQDGHDARMPQNAVDVMRCTDFVRGRGGGDTSSAVYLTGVILTPTFATRYFIAR
jgi:hypothetical protein